MFSFLLGVLLTVPSPTPPPAPCKAAHHLFCGPIRFVPHDPDARNLFFGNAIATFFDGVVTAKNTHGNPALEANPVMRPFVRGGLPGLLLGWSAMEIGQHAVLHAFRLSDRRELALTAHVRVGAERMANVPSTVHRSGMDPLQCNGRTFLNA